MYRITKEFKFPMGHRLSKHKGLCHNLHGHNFKVQVTVESEELNSNDMVIDFSDLKKVVNSILKEFDHAMVLNPQDTDTIEYMKSNDNLLIFITDEFDDQDPTAEILSKYLYEEINRHLYLHSDNLVSVYSVKVWENDSGMAEYIK